MVQRTFSRQPAFRADLPAVKGLPFKPPVTKTATVKTVELRSTAIPDAAPGGGIPRLLRLRQVIAPHGPIPVSKNTWLAWVASKYAPAPHPLSTRIRVWLENDIIAFITDKLNKKDA